MGGTSRFSLSKSPCRGTCFRKSYDGSMNAGKLWFSAPLRMVELTEVGLWRNDQYEVFPVGVNYGIRSVRDGRLDDRVFASAAAAKAEILRRQPTKLA
jgi:hypothetical protein